MIGICPNCNQRYSYNSYDTDYVHKCHTASDSITEDDVVVVGNYTNEATGEVVTKPKLSVALQGLPNKLDGTRAGIEGKDSEALTEKGNRASTHRQRQHYEYIKIR